MDPQQEKEMAIWREQKKAEIIEELTKNEILQKFLEKTYPSSRESFIKDYATKKVRWLEWGPKFVKLNERDDLEWINDATKRLVEIQQKKLFDKQCLWRAEKISIKEVEQCIDFTYWEDNIFNCPFIDSVNEQDLEIYRQYIQSGSFEMEQGFMSRWQDYDSIKAAYNDEKTYRDFPSWYDFHNTITGFSSYMMLPNIRGEKEKKYLILAAKERQKDQKAQNEVKKMVENVLPETKVQSKPALDYYKKGWMTWFVDNFEDQETQEAFRKYGGERFYHEKDDEYDEGDMYEVFQLLARAGKTVGVEDHYDWRYAIYKSAYMYKCGKISEALPIAYQQYRVNIDMKIAFEEENLFKDLIKTYRDSILRGRELNGEPSDFNF
jgi:hypothetical protein